MKRILLLVSMVMCVGLALGFNKAGREIYPSGDLIAPDHFAWNPVGSDVVLAASNLFLAVEERYALAFNLTNEVYTLAPPPVITSLVARFFNTNYTEVPPMVYPAINTDGSYGWYTNHSGAVSINGRDVWGTIVDPVLFETQISGETFFTSAGDDPNTAIYHDTTIALPGVVPDNTDYLDYFHAAYQSSNWVYAISSDGVTVNYTNFLCSAIGGPVVTFEYILTVQAGRPSVNDLMNVYEVFDVTVGRDRVILGDGSEVLGAQRIVDAYTINQMGPFTFEYPVYMVSGQNSNVLEQVITNITAYPPLTEKFWMTLDRAMYNMTPRFVSTNKYNFTTNDLGVPYGYSNWFNTQWTNPITLGIEYPSDYPYCSPAEVMHTLGIGFSTNVVYDNFQHISGGEGYFLRQPLVYDSPWFLSEGVVKSNGLITTLPNRVDMGSRFYGTNTPTIVYKPASGVSNVVDLWLMGSLEHLNTQAVVPILDATGAYAITVINVSPGTNTIPPIVIPGYDDYSWGWHSITSITFVGGAANPQPGMSRSSFIVKYPEYTLFSTWPTVDTSTLLIGPLQGVSTNGGTYSLYSCPYYVWGGAFYQMYTNLIDERVQYLDALKFTTKPWDGWTNQVGVILYLTNSLLNVWEFTDYPNWYLNTNFDEYASTNITTNYSGAANIYATRYTYLTNLYELKWRDPSFFDIPYVVDPAGPGAIFSNDIYCLYVTNIIGSSPGPLMSMNISTVTTNTWELNFSSATHTNLAGNWLADPLTNGNGYVVGTVNRYLHNNIEFTYVYGQAYSRPVSRYAQTKGDRLYLRDEEYYANTNGCGIGGDSPVVMIARRETNDAAVVLTDFLYPPYLTAQGIGPGILTNITSSTGSVYTNRYVCTNLDLLSYSTVSNGGSAWDDTTVATVNLDAWEYLSNQWAQWNSIIWEVAPTNAAGDPSDFVVTNTVYTVIPPIEASGFVAGSLTPSYTNLNGFNGVYTPNYSPDYAHPAGGPLWTDYYWEMDTDWKLATFTNSAGAFSVNLAWNDNDYPGGNGSARSYSTAEYPAVSGWEYQSETDPFEYTMPLALTEFVVGTYITNSVSYPETTNSPISIYYWTLSAYSGDVSYASILPEGEYTDYLGFSGYWEEQTGTPPNYDPANYPTWTTNGLSHSGCIDGGGEQWWLEPAGGGTNYIIRGPINPLSDFYRPDANGTRFWLEQPSGFPWPYTSDAGYHLGWLHGFNLSGARLLFGESTEFYQRLIVEKDGMAYLLLSRSSVTYGGMVTDRIYVTDTANLLLYLWADWEKVTVYVFQHDLSIGSYRIITDTVSLRPRMVEGGALVLEDVFGDFSSLDPLIPTENYYAIDGTWLESHVDTNAAVCVSVTREFVTIPGMFPNFIGSVPVGWLKSSRQYAEMSQIVSASGSVSNQPPLPVLMRWDTGNYGLEYLIR